MQYVTLPEMIAIVNNPAQRYVVTFSVFEGVGTLVAASAECNNVYTLQVPNLEYKGLYHGGKRITSNEELKGVSKEDLYYIYHYGDYDFYVTTYEWVLTVENVKTHQIWNARDHKVRWGSV